MARFPIPLLPALLLLAAAPLGAQEGEDGGGSLGDLFDKVKDIKVPDSVTGLPKQLADLKKAYLETAETVEELRLEVAALREEVDSLRRENQELREAVGAKVKKEKLTAMLDPIEISATDLVEHYQQDPASADEQYRDRYLKVVGTIAAFETSARGIDLYLRADGFDSRVKCTLQTGPDLYVDVLPTQGRLISRNDRRTLLAVGQPVAILGTCQGARLNVEMTNCRIEGLVEKRKDSQSKDQ